VAVASVIYAGVMSQPPGPGVPPEFQPPPPAYGGYGGSLQSYGRPGYGAPGHPPPVGPGPAPEPVLGTPQQASAVPPAGVPIAAGAERPPQRPAVIGLATTLAATASLQWVAVLSFGWLVASAGTAQLDTSGVDGGVYHVLDRIAYRLSDGLAWPLYLFPAMSFVLSFLLLSGREWTRLAFTVTGAAALGWSAWWLRDNLLWWSIPAGYIALTVLVSWTAEATHWYRWRQRSDPAGQLR
jgi:hypothetical protein